MKQLFIISTIIVSLILAVGCSKSSTDISPDNLGISKKILNSDEQEKNGTDEWKNTTNTNSNVVASNPNVLVMNVTNLGVVNKTVGQTPWLPAKATGWALTYDFVSSVNKTADVSTTLSASICSKSTLLSLFFQACGEAQRQMNTTQNMSSTVSAKIVLKPFEQRRYVLINRYNRYRGTFKLSGPTNITDPNIIYDIPLGSQYAGFESRILK